MKRVDRETETGKAHTEKISIICSYREVTSVGALFYQNLTTYYSNYIIILILIVINQFSVICISRNFIPGDNTLMLYFLLTFLRTKLTAF
jgi:hypothetical protein